MLAVGSGVLAYYQLPEWFPGLFKNELPATHAGVDAVSGCHKEKQLSAIACFIEEISHCFRQQSFMILLVWGDFGKKGKIWPFARAILWLDCDHA
jgi:hypothetical protein